MHCSDLSAEEEYALVKEVGGHHERVRVRLLVGSETPLAQIHSNTDIRAHKLTNFIQSPNVDWIVGNWIIQFHETAGSAAVLSIAKEPDEGVLI